MICGNCNKEKKRNGKHVFWDGMKQFICNSCIKGDSYTVKRKHKPKYKKVKKCL